MLDKIYTKTFSYFCNKASEKALQKISIDGVTSIYNLKYGKATTNVFDMHFPSDGNAHTTIFLIHGGGYVSGKKEDVNRYIVELLKNNYCVVNMEYSKCSNKNAIHLPKQINEVFDCFKFLSRHIELSSAIDYNNFFIAGDSAGAHIAALVANIQTNDGLKYDFNLTGGPKIKGGIYICPVFGNFKFKGLCPKNQLKKLLYGKNNTISEICHNLDILSPYFPPSIVFTTPNDIISRKHTKLFAEKAKENNIPSRIRVVTSGYKLGHNSIAQYANEYPSSMSEIAQFVEDCKSNILSRTVSIEKITELENKAENQLSFIQNER